MTRTLPLLALALALSFVGAARALTVDPMPPATPTPECKIGSPQSGMRNMETPVKAAKEAQSGWVQVQFDVVNGKVVDPQIRAASPKGFFEQAGLQWVSQLGYRAEANGHGCLLSYTFSFGPQ
jgi:hypothetical protein